MKIICYSRKTYKIIQKHLFNQGYEWSTTGLGVWYPHGSNWDDGEVIEFRTDDTYKYLYCNGKFNKSYDMTDQEYINKFMYIKFNIERDIVNVFDDVINEII